jgi:hypothetical protein
MTSLTPVSVINWNIVTHIARMLRYILLDEHEIKRDKVTRLRKFEKKCLNTE